MNACFFDMDGTLIDSRADLTATVNHTRRDLALAELPQEEVLVHVGQGARHLLARAIPDRDAREALLRDVVAHGTTPQARKIAAGEPCIANGTRWDPESQFQMLWMFDTLKRPIHISEITIPAPDDTPEGEEVQARMIHDNYRLWFWPSVYRITYWNLVDHTFHKENLASGLYTVDMRKKKAYYALDRLINQEWKTRLTLQADEKGRVAFRGFRGRYRLSWKDATGNSVSKLVDVQ